jgi:SAM-dependent methyltransferase
MATSVRPGAGVRNILKGAKHFVSETLYERRYGVKTSGRTILDQHNAENISYAPMNWRQLSWALPRKSVTSQDVFIDIGSGKGRAVLMAAMDYPFSRVIGVELMRELHEAAEENMAAVAGRIKAGSVELVCADLREYELPDDVTVIYMNNPVRGSIFAGFLDTIAASQKRAPRPMRLIYHNPTEQDALLGTGNWTKTNTVVRRRERANWPFGTTCVYEWSSAGK